MLSVNTEGYVKTDFLRKESQNRFEQNLPSSAHRDYGVGFVRYSDDAAWARQVNDILYVDKARNNLHSVFAFGNHIEWWDIQLRESRPPEDPFYFSCLCKPTRPVRKRQHT